MFLLVWEEQTILPCILCTFAILLNPLKQNKLLVRMIIIIITMLLKFFFLLDYYYSYFAQKYIFTSL